MKPAPFDYVRADSVEHITALLAQHGEAARVLAGGQSLMAVLNMRLASPSLLIDLSRSAALAETRIEHGALQIGAAATQASIEWRTSLADEVPLLALALPFVSHFQVRNRGTVCGSVAHADPSAELPLCLVALQGEVMLARAGKRRRVGAADFFTGLLSTACAADEMVEAVRFPLAAHGTGHGFAESSMRHGDFALAALAAVSNDDGLRVAAGGVADRPLACELPAGLDGSALDDALNDFAWRLDARDDPVISASARRHLVRRLGRQAVNDAHRRADASRASAS